MYKSPIGRCLKWGKAWGPKYAIVIKLNNGFSTSVDTSNDLGFGTKHELTNLNSKFQNCFSACVELRKH